MVLQFEEVTRMAWVLLVVAGLLEIGWAIGLKYTKGFTELWPTVGTVVSMIASVGLPLGCLDENPSLGNGICGLDGHRSNRDSHTWYRAVRGVCGYWSLDMRCPHSGWYRWT